MIAGQPRQNTAENTAAEDQHDDRVLQVWRGEENPRS